jgi:putative DNA primase/helicase
MDDSIKHDEPLRIPGPPVATLSDEHRAMLEGTEPGQSAISRPVVDARGYRTVQRRDELPDVFKGKQRRRGLLIPTLSPSGERGYRLRPDKPISPGRKYEQPAGIGCILDIHPFSWEAVRDKAVDLWIVEGEKKADSLVSRGECAVALPGVFNWQRGGEPLPCWEHVTLEGRIVYVAFDSDVLTNSQVQLALKRLVAFLDGLGAHVLVVYLPEVQDA